MSAKSFDQDHPFDITDNDDFENDDLVEFQHFYYSQLTKYSKHIRDSYLFSDVTNRFPQEIRDFQEECQFLPESVDYFFQLLNKNFNIEEDLILTYIQCIDLLKISKHLEVRKLFFKINQYIKSHNIDVDFAIQMVEYEIKTRKETNNYDIEISNEVESSLINKINECFTNEKFKNLPIQIIYRVIKQCSPDSIDSDKLFDIIVSSLSKFCVLFPFLDLQKLSDDRLDELCRMYSKSNEDTQHCYDYLKCNLNLINEINDRKKKLEKMSAEQKNKLSDLEKLLQKQFSESEKVNTQLDDSKKLIIDQQNKVKDLESQMELLQNRFNDSEKANNKLQSQLDDSKEKNDEQKNKMKDLESKIELLQNQVNEFNNANSKQLNKMKDLEKIITQLQNKLEDSSKQKTESLNEREENGFNQHSIQYAKNIIVGGYDEYHQIGENPNKNQNGNQVIYPPQNLPLDPSSLLSYSGYLDHCVAVTRSGSLSGVGDNRDGRICSLLGKSVINQITNFWINDCCGRRLVPVSAVCTLGGTLYMFTKSEGSGRQLVYCESEINGGTPVFLDIGRHEPVSLFGGRSYAAAICAEGEVIFINCHVVRNSPSSPIAASSLPGGEKAKMVAVLSKSVFALSSCGHVFASDVELKSCVLKFSAVSELSGVEIVWLSGTSEHCFAVCSDGRVFGRGSNDSGKLGFSKETSSVPSFTEIWSLSSHKIRAAYAGCSHSLFETRDGKILACGFNYHNELLLSYSPSNCVYSPTEITITGGATFCIAGQMISAVFIGGEPPQNMPNRPVQ